MTWTIFRNFHALPRWAYVCSCSLSLTFLGQFWRLCWSYLPSVFVFTSFLHLFHLDIQIFFFIAFFSSNFSSKVIVVGQQSEDTFRLFWKSIGGQCRIQWVHNKYYNLLMSQKILEFTHEQFQLWKCPEASDCDDVCITQHLLYWWIDIDNKNFMTRKVNY